MSADATRRRPVEKDIVGSAGLAPTEEQNVEVGPDAANIDRIEKVYRCVERCNS